MSQDTDTPPEADRAPGAPHPRETLRLIGQDKAEAAFLDAVQSGRMHHAWLITGPMGVGKATLAWKLARFLLATPVPGSGGGGLFDDAPAPVPDRLEIDPSHPVAIHMQALSEPRLFLLRRAWDADKQRLKTVITVDEVRKLKHFFEMSATDGGRRVVIVDAADEMNVSAANALLKVLEEPPTDAVLLLISHQPSRLLPTIRSRCRELRCHPLSPTDMAAALAAAGAEAPEDTTALATLAGGSVGEALRLINLGGLETYQQIVDLAVTLPRLDRARALALAESAVGKGKEEAYGLLLTLYDTFLARLARTGAGGPPLMQAARGEAELMRRLAPTPETGRQWATLQAELGARVRHGRAVNLDPAALILDMVFRTDQMAAKTSRP